MALSNDLISQFVKITNDTKSTTKNTTVYGTVIISDGKKYVQLDGSPDGMLTPVDTITDVEDKDRVIVDIQDHTATITGNLTTPSVNENSTVQNGDGTSTKITDLGIAIADKVSAKTLNAEIARIDTLEANEATITGNLNANTAAIGELKTGVATIEGKLTAAEADIDDLEADNVTIKDTLTANKIEVDGKISANEASINELDANYAEFKNTTTNNLEAINAGIENLETKKLDTDKAEITYANIDFSNIGKAAMEYFYANSGLIQDVTVNNGTITGNLVGVTISGDLIKGNTVKADKLVVLGSDGLYYKLNFESGNFTDAEEVPTDSLHGSVITANSITAEKVNVSDLVAFGAKIGGFTITDNSIYSGVKESIDNSTRGLYFDNDGQLYLGDATNFLRYYNDQKYLSVTYDPDTGEYVTGEENTKPHKLDTELKMSTSKNLVPYPYTDLPTTINGLTITDNGDGSVTINGTATDDIINPYDICLAQITLFDGVTYTISGGPAGGQQYSTYWCSYMDVSNTVNDSPKTITITGDTLIPVSLYVMSGTTLNNVVIKLQVEYGNTATDYVKGTTPETVYTNTGEVIYAYQYGSTSFNYFCVRDEYKLEIAAESILFGANSRTSAEDLRNIIEHIHIGTYTNPDTGEDEPSISLYEDDTDFKQIITNTKTIFTDGSIEHTAIRTDGVMTENVTIKNELKHGDFVWSIRANGNYGLMWKGV